MGGARARGSVAREIECVRVLRAFVVALIADRGLTLCQSAGSGLLDL